MPRTGGGASSHRRRFLQSAAAVSGVALAGLPVARAAGAVASRAGGAAGATTGAPAFAGTLTGVAETAARAVAVGRHSDGFVALWVRDHGGDDRWRAVAPDSAIATAELTGVSVVADAFLATGAVAATPSAAELGQPGRPAPTQPRPFPAAWRSTDGVAWQQVAVTAGTAGRLFSSAWSGSEALAVGCVVADEADVPTQPLVLRSRDGRVWRTGRVLGLPVGEGELTSVAHADSRWWVTSVGVGGAALWSSADATQWHPAALPTVAGGPVAGRVCAVDGSLVVVGTGLFDLTVRAWTSQGARGSWQPTAVPAATTRSGVTVAAVAATAAATVSVVGERHGDALLDSAGVR